MGCVAAAGPAILTFNNIGRPSDPTNTSHTRKTRVYMTLPAIRWAIEFFGA